MIPATIFLSAFLLFLVQPIIAKLILPQFGGGVAVWATCLVFFQLALLLGYAYAHQVVKRDRTGRLRRLHIGLLLLSLLVLPIIPGEASVLSPTAGPSAQIVVLLLVTIGLPFALLATTSPLLQAWLAREGTRRDPYRLFVVSNLASLFALVTYPWLIEPWLGTTTQARVWSTLYAMYVALATAVAVTHGRRAHAQTAQASGAALGMAAAISVPRAIGMPRTLGWIALAALASYELVAVTNHLTQNVPSMPMMWVLPLGVYLLTFTLCFDGDRWYRPAAFRAATLVAVLSMCWMLYDLDLVHRFVPQAGVFVAGLFVVCMFCHGELARDRPPPLQLTQFYLCVAGGGALGGALVGLGAPALLPGYFEVEIGLVLVTLAVLWRSLRRSIAWLVAGSAATVCAAATAAYRIDGSTDEVLSMSRNFYGVVRVRERGDAGDPSTHERTLVHGSILHGQQYLSGDARRRPTSYYVESSGIGRVLRALGERPLDVGVVGLGTGTIAAYGKPGDRYHFFEIDPAVVAVAQRYFTFLSDSEASVQVHVGDGRLLLQRTEPLRFDVLAVDAFSGDSIPVHLLTREAIALYLQRLKPGGVVALHVSNRYLDLRPVVGRIAADMGLQSAYVEDEIQEHDGPEKSSSDWILLAREGDVLAQPLIRGATRGLPNARPKRAWTDDYSNIAQVMALTRPVAN
ncbi:MAG: fused MFS/spermidine synthase [Burkholderiaceae bacterium]|nr:fused MFS/spermidine synthase [Burkholderiaceae bacterium]